MDPLKRPTKRRSANFTMQESNILIDLIISRGGLLVRSGQDAPSFKLKNRVWKDITDAFNAQSLQQRTVDTLRKRFENMKKDLKSKMAAHAKELVITEAGDVEVESLTLLPHEKKLVKLLNITKTLLSSWLSQDPSTKAVFDKGDDTSNEPLSPDSDNTPESKYSPPQAESDSSAESLLMAVMESLSDAEESDCEIPEKRTREEGAPEQTMKEEMTTSTRTDKRKKDSNLRLLSERVLRQKAELLKLQIDNQKTEMQRASQIHTYTLKTMEAELRIKNLQEKLLREQLCRGKVNGT